MRLSNKKLSISLNTILAGYLLSISVAQALPSEITFSNDTSLALATSISGMPGQGVAANVTKSVSYVLVSMGCYYSGFMNNCPIEFSDKSNGEKVATVYINAETATLTQPPIMYGHYANEYDVQGWETSPISHISIVKKA